MWDCVCGIPNLQVLSTSCVETGEGMLCFFLYLVINLIPVTIKLHGVTRSSNINSRNSSRFCIEVEEI